jgi:hypothetical protein
MKASLKEGLSKMRRIIVDRDRTVAFLGDMRLLNYAGTSSIPVEKRSSNM